MNNNLQKYFGLMALLIGAFTVFVLLVIGLFYLLKLFSITLFAIPGTEKVYHFLIVLVPYTVFFFGYYYMHKKIRTSINRTARFFATLFLIAGSLICFGCLVLAVLDYFSLKTAWVKTYRENSHYGLASQIIMLFFTAMILASGDPKEKDWMERDGVKNSQA
ncbi:MAG: hypothetical protein QM791_15935 [Ferruginibacter sp.]